MVLPKLDFYFDYMGACAWVDGHAVKYDKLPVSDGLKKELEALCCEYDDQIDWSDPGNSEGWTKEHEDGFYRRAAQVGKKLQDELKDRYKVINHFEEYL